MPSCRAQGQLYRFLLHRLRVFEKKVLRKALGLRGGSNRRLMNIA
jgi:hypothetical protein